VILAHLCDSIKEGLEERKIEKADSNAAEAQDEEGAPRRERKGKTTAKKERISKDDDEAINAAVVSKVVKDEE